MKIDWPDIFKNGAYIAKDDDGGINAFTKKPKVIKIYAMWISNGEFSALEPDIFDLSFLPQEWWDLPWQESLIQKPEGE